MGKLDGKIAIVTGGGTGIGREIALLFAKNGADVTVAGRTPANIQKVSDDIKAIGRRSVAIATDVAVAEQVRSLVKQTVDKFGRIDIMVNNAGVASRALIVDMTEEIWDKVINTNLKGAFLGTQAAAKYMIEQKYGKIINISSTAGIHPSSKGMSNYGASKAGINMFTTYAALQLAPYGINVNCVAPATIDNEQLRKLGKAFEDKIKNITISGRFGTTLELANTALFLATDNSSYINGQTISVDGGGIYG
jgi:3-oxoacyl-[acyl-carrier protein] reductase